MRGNLGKITYKHIRNDLVVYSLNDYSYIVQDLK